MRKTTSIMILLLALSLIMIAACKPTNNGPIGDPMEKRVESGATIVHKTHGGFTLPEYNVLELTITKDKAVLQIKGFDGTLTATEEITLTSQEYEMYIKLLNDNDFMKLNYLYEPKAGGPMVADTGNLEITVSQIGKVKKVEVIPYADWYMSEKLQKIDEELQKIKSELFEQYLNKQQLNGDEQVAIQFQPIQCEQAPWQEWYSLRMNPLPEPEPETLIKMYYEEIHDVQISGFEIINPDRFVAAVCGGITSNYYTAFVNAEGLQIVLDEGWTEI